MSKPRYSWWGYIKAVIRNYPEHYEALQGAKLPTITASYSAMPRGSSPGMPVEQLALRTLPRDQQKEYDAVCNSVRITKRYTDGEERIKLVDMVFWRKTHTLQGAAMDLNISYSTAKRWHNKFIVSVAISMDIHHPEQS